MTFLGKPTQVSGSHVWDGSKFVASVITGSGGGGESFFFSRTAGIVEQSGSLAMSGSGLFKSGLTGALNRLPDGSHFLNAGNNITLSTGSNGQITINSIVSASFNSGSFISLNVTDYASTSNTSSSPQSVGQLIFDPRNFTGPVTFRSVLASTTGSVTASLQLFNVTSGTFVHIGGASVTTLTTTNTTPTILESVNLRNATNFSTGSAIYELQIYTETGSQTSIIGGAEFRVTGAITTAPTRLNLGSYAISTATSSNPEAVGGGYFVPSEHNQLNCVFRAIIATTTGSNSGSVQLYNVTSGALVHIGGAGVTSIGTNSTTPIMLQSVNLLVATNFNPITSSIYEVRIYGSGSSPITTLINSELVCS